MLGILLSVAVLCILLWLYIRWTHVKLYWEQRGVPHLPPHPIIGSLTFLQRKNASKWMIEMYQRFKSPYIGVWWFWRPVLLINSPELARNVLVKDSANFRNRFTSSGSSDIIGSLNLFTLKEPHWSPVRRHLTNVFTASKLKAHQTLLDTKSSQLIQRINTSADSSKVSLRILLTDYTTDIIGTAAFGVKTNATLSGEDPMRRVTKAFMTFNLLRGISWSCAFFLPELINVFRLSLFPKWATDYFQKVLTIASQKRKKEKNDLSNPRDLLDALITLKEEDGKVNKDMVDDIIIAQAAAFLFGGYETSGTAITFAIYELAFNIDIQEKLYEELLEIRENKNDQLNITKLGELVYLNCIIKETLRKYAPMGWLDRIATNDYKVDDNLTITAGTPIYVNAIGMHYNEELFPEPEKFRPERFLPENEKDIKQFTYMPFGEGPRNCIGQRFGIITMRHALAYLVLNYNLRPTADAVKPNEIEFEKYGLLLVPGQDLHVNFIPRN